MSNQGKGINEIVLNDEQNMNKRRAEQFKCQELTGQSTEMKTYTGCGSGLGHKKDSSGYHCQLALSTRYNNVGSQVWSTEYYLGKNEWLVYRQKTQKKKFQFWGEIFEQDAKVFMGTCHNVSQ